MKDLDLMLRRRGLDADNRDLKQGKRPKGADGLRGPMSAAIPLVQRTSLVKTKLIFNNVSNTCVVAYLA